MTTEAISHSNTCERYTQSSLFGQLPRTSRDGSAQRTTPLEASSLAWWEQMPPSFQQEGSDGPTQVWLLAPADPLLGESSMLNFSAYPNDAVGSSLSQVLETVRIPRRYFLSARACAGILRRAEKRGKTLPVALEAALVAVAEHPTPTE